MEEIKIYYCTSLELCPAGPCACMCMAGLAPDDVGLWCWSDNICSWARADVAVKNRNIFPDPGGSESHLYCSCYSFVCGGDEKLNWALEGKITNKEGGSTSLIVDEDVNVVSSFLGLKRCRLEKWSIVSDQGTNFDTNYHAPKDHLNLIKK